jgi:hypothetical protein
MRPAFAVNSGSRGKIQQRCCHGRIASSLSQRHPVQSLMVDRSPVRRASRAISVIPNRESGRLRVAGTHSQCLNVHDQLWGKRPEADPSAGVLQCRAIVLQKNVFSTCLQPPAVFKRRLISSFVNPSAANRIILARSTFL